MSHVTVSGAPDAPAESATETNRRIVRRAFDAWRDGTGTITDLFAPDMVWRIEGRSLASKAYGDEQQFVAEVLAPFAARFPASAPFRPVTIRSVQADGDTVVVDSIAFDELWTRVRPRTRS